MSKSLRKWCGLAICFTPALLALYLILSDGVNLQIMDPWSPDVAGLFIKAHQGLLSFSDFFKQANEHRIVIPKLIFFLLGSLTHWNVIAEMVTTWVVLCLTSVGVLRLSIRTLGGQLDWRVLFVWFICNLLIFTPAQWEVLLSGILLINALPTAFMILGMNAAMSGLRLWMKTAVALICCSAATFSFGNGVLSWGLVGVVLFWSDSRDEFKRKRWALLSWVGIFLLSLAIYRGGYHEPDHGTEQGTYFAGFWPVFRYLLVFLGNEFGFVSTLQPVTMATIIGCLALMMLILSAVYFFYVWIRSHDVELSGRILVWLAVGSYAVLSGILAGLFRAGLGPEQAGASRYVTFSIFLPVALANLVPIICGDIRRRIPALTGVGADRWLAIPPALACWVILLCGFSLWPGFNGGLLCAINRRSAKAALMLIDVAPDAAQLTNYVLSDLPKLTSVVHTMDEIGYLNPPLIRATSATQLQQYAADATDRARGRLERVFQASADEVTVVGWATDGRQLNPADGVFLTIQDNLGEPIIVATAKIGLRRDDLGARENNQGFVWSGWQATVPLARLHLTTRPARLEAWALDVRTGRISKLEGGVPMANHPG